MNDLIEKLFSLGLSEYESNVYIQLIQADKQTASGLAQSSNVPRTKIYSVLEGLVTKGMCYETKGKTKLYSATHPIDAFNDIVDGYKDKYEEAAKIAKDLALVFSERDQQEVNESELEVLHTPLIIRERIIRYTWEAKDEVLSMEKPPYAYAYEECTETEPLLVSMRALIGVSELEDDAIYNRTQKENNAGKGVRIMDTIPLKYIIFDNKRLLLPLKKSSLNDKQTQAIITTNPDIINYFIQTFNMFYEKALPFEEFKRGRDAE